MKLIAQRKSDQNRSSIDPWTVVHFSMGLATGLVDIPFRSAISAAIAYEVVEQFVERKDYGKQFFKTSGPEVISNAIVDTAVFALGHWMGQIWNRS